MITFPPQFELNDMNLIPLKDMIMKMMPERYEDEDDNLERYEDDNFSPSVRVERYEEAPRGGAEGPRRYHRETESRKVTRYIDIDILSPDILILTLIY